MNIKCAYLIIAGIIILAISPTQAQNITADALAGKTFSGWFEIRDGRDSRAEISMKKIGIADNILAGEWRLKDWNRDSNATLRHEKDGKLHWAEFGTIPRTFDISIENGKIFLRTKYRNSRGEVTWTLSAKK